jgi:hypothetical protein
LGERLNGIQEVRGSIPLGSTIRFSNLLMRSVFEIVPKRLTVVWESAGVNSELV